MTISDADRRLKAIEHAQEIEQLRATSEALRAQVASLENDIAQKRAIISKTVDKILMSRLPAETKVAMIRAQHAKLKTLSNGGAS